MQDNKCTKWCKISSYKRQSYQKHSWVFRKIFNFDSKWETPYHTPLKNFMDNPPTHSKKEKHTSPCLFSHNKGMNTMISVLQPLFPPLLSSTRPQVYFKARLPLSVSHMDTLSYVHGSRVRSYVVQIGAKLQDSGWSTCCIVGCVHADV